jgi:hypothetical protein
VDTTTRTDYCADAPGPCTHHRDIAEHERFGALVRGVWADEIQHQQESEEALADMLGGLPPSIVVPEVTEDFCADYKGEHTFEEGKAVCRCRRAYKPHPSMVRTRPQLAEMREDVDADLVPHEQAGRC